LSNNFGFFGEILGVDDKNADLSIIGTAGNGGLLRDL
jgi:hypothetical protein